MKKKLLGLSLVALSVASGPAVWAQDFKNGYVAYEAGDYATALEEWKPLAEQGDATAQYYLGLMYENGHGVLQDYTEAVKWWRQAAEQEFAYAQNNLGLMWSLLDLCGFPGSLRLERGLHFVRPVGASGA